MSLILFICSFPPTSYYCRSRTIRVTDHNATLTHGLLKCRPTEINHKPCIFIWNISILAVALLVFGSQQRPYMDERVQCYVASKLYVHTRTGATHLPSNRPIKHLNFTHWNRSTNFLNELYLTARRFSCDFNKNAPKTSDSTKIVRRLIQSSATLHC